MTGFDGTTLQLGFVNAGARDNFASSGSEDVLKAALTEQFGVHWKIDSVVDASGAGAPAPPAPGYGGGYTPPPAPAPAPAPQAPTAPAPSAPAPAQAPAPPPRRTVSVEDDVPEDDDPDLDENALSGHELIVRELGATVVEEFTNE
ncbi:DNA polymerase III subunit gamma/tau [Streptomyces sp. Q6]|uniref:DNA polymerase III subunit gamma/tau n=1 Tax=Streptomyces citrinus TaxID=3118173 RepID=A0ACD5ADJ5_9ACTN